MSLMRHICPFLLILILASCSRVPRPDFSYHPYSNPESGDSIKFSNQTKHGKDYEWEFGDGEVSHMTHPVHIYREAGIFEIKLTAINDAGSELIRESVTINEPTILTFAVYDSTRTLHLEGAEVWVYDDESMRDSLELPLLAALADSSGHVHFHNVEPQVYHIWVSRQEAEGAWTYRGFTNPVKQNKVNNYIVPCRWTPY